MKSAAEQWLLLFVKAPSPGEVKTRLLPRLSPDEACALYRCLVRDTMDAVRRLQDVRVVVAYAANAEFPDLAWLGDAQRPAPEMFLQQGKTLGDRLGHAFAWAFARQARRVAALGSDAPDLSPAWIQRALEELHACDVVLGPARDGGYHLIGLTRPQPELFAGMPWSSSSLLARTRERIAHLGLRLWMLEPVADLDTPEDLRRYLEELGRRRPATRTAHYLLALPGGSTCAAGALGRSARARGPGVGLGQRGSRREGSTAGPSPARPPSD